MRNTIIIPFYIENVYGVPREYICSSHKSDAKIIQQLTGQKSINPVTRELIRDLSRGAITFQQTIKS